MHYLQKTVNYLFNKYYHELIDALLLILPDKQVIQAAHATRNNNSLKNLDLYRKMSIEALLALLENGGTTEKSDLYLCREGPAMDVMSHMQDNNDRAMVLSFVSILTALAIVFGRVDEQDEIGSKALLDYCLEIVRKVQRNEDATKMLERVQNQDAQLGQTLVQYRRYSSEIDRQAFADKYTSKALAQQEGSSSGAPPPNEERGPTGLEDMPDFIKNTQLAKMGLDIFNQCFDDVKEAPQDINGFLSSGKLGQVFSKTASYLDEKSKKKELDFGTMVQECGSLFSNMFQQQTQNRGGAPPFTPQDVQRMASLFRPQAE